MSVMVKKSWFAVGSIALLLGVGGIAAFSQSQAQGDQLRLVENQTPIPSQVIAAEVYRTPTCGCCGAWVDHSEANGFTFTDNIQPDITAIKEQFGITPELASCHTTVANGYVFEGHIPAADIQRFLANPPADVVGLTVPGMPIGSPGMEAGDRQQAYQVLALHKDGTTSVFQEYPGN
ncbi:hypothetical protein AWQ21_12945 [Picosynechococcus sp. PCC 7003]|nr:hypothetical protein AWQ21_12945 [Picosynechococcus sp. PCC 7003]QCS50781.1 DUF411 domain-containing protein [Picosynechococcus sp. PCC 11901]